jgi:hypothetical protein
VLGLGCAVTLSIVVFGPHDDPSVIRKFDAEFVRIRGAGFLGCLDAWADCLGIAVSLRLQRPI